MDVKEESEILNLQKDMAFIKNEILAKQTNGNYCKYSKALRGIAIIDLTEEAHINYWIARYKDRPEDKKQIIKCCKKKLKEDLISSQEMINLILKSKDFASEKQKAIELLGGVYNE